MIDRSPMIVAPLARWSSRFAVFSASLLVVGVVLHRLTSFPTHVAVNLFAVGAAGMGLALLAGLIALLQIWRRGLGGAGKAAFGVLLPLLMLAWPLTFVPALMNLPRINDVTTDVAAPPRFVSLAKVRTADANPVAYPGERFAQEQQKAYPDLRTFVLDRGVEEAFELVEEVVRKLKWKVAASDPPSAKPAQERRARGDRPDAGDRLHRRHHHPRRWHCHSLAHRRALRLALWPHGHGPECDCACAASSPSCNRAPMPPAPPSWPGGAGCARPGPEPWSRK